MLPLDVAVPWTSLVQSFGAGRKNQRRSAKLVLIGMTASSAWSASMSPIELYPSIAPQVRA